MTNPYGSASEIEKFETKRAQMFQEFVNAHRLLGRKVMDAVFAGNVPWVDGRLQLDKGSLVLNASDDTKRAWAEKYDELLSYLPRYMEAAGLMITFENEKARRSET